MLHAASFALASVLPSSTTFVYKVAAGAAHFLSHSFSLPFFLAQIAADPVARALKVSDGAMIQTVEANSPAAAAGLLGTRRGLGGIVAGEPWGAAAMRIFPPCADLRRQNILSSRARLPAGPGCREVLAGWQA